MFQMQDFQKNQITDYQSCTRRGSNFVQSSGICGKPYSSRKRKTVRLNGTTRMVCYIGNFYQRMTLWKGIFSAYRPRENSYISDEIRPWLYISRAFRYSADNNPGNLWDFRVTSVDIVNHVTFANVPCRKVSRVPLKRLPLIDVPFKRVAIG